MDAYPRRMNPMVNLIWTTETEWGDLSCSRGHKQCDYCAVVDKSVAQFVAAFSLTVSTVRNVRPVGLLDMFLPFTTSFSDATDNYSKCLYIVAGGE